ncbi:hypothetical protein [Microbulbifer sp. VAAF005]|uniref:hypothetical protein n=1 Tax=Microbulbifer sp. VAAF005 TaxID=3034230 RepID=UPI0024AE3D07|nr:hypothetical protein [Microbulbifer sp. VAAF005]WHI48411.1 hypothetical protein P0078_08580 [Microbulbifer sp. VAAF005]
MCYEKRFELALDKTLEIFGESESVNLNLDNRYISEKPLFALFKKVYESAKSRGIKLAGNCTTIHWNTVDELSRALNCKAYFTVGYVVDAGHEYFKFTYEDVQEWLRSGQSSKKVMLHAWLTLDSMEIVDFTLGPTIADVRPDQKHLEKAIIALSPEEQDEGFHYIPMIVKDDFLMRIQAYG